MKRFLLITTLLLAMLDANAWRDMTMKQLHVSGRYLCDADGNHITLHGFGQTYSPYFNGYAWCKNADGTVNWSETYNTTKCVAWNEEQISKMLDAGWKVNWLRLHMDPHWSNTPGASVTGESDISAFSEERFKTYLQSVFIPMAKYAIENGLYVVMRPPGVCPKDLSVGDSYHQYLIKVWKIVCSDSYLKNNPYIMFELANEPITMNDGSGNYSSYTDGSLQQCTKFFQQIVDEIRSLGCNNVLWVPGLSYQMNYQGYVKYPVVEPATVPDVSSSGWGIGYAVHCYPGWYGSDSESDSGSAEQGVVTKGAGYVEFRDGWNANVAGVAANAPVLITEMDWAPQKYNSSWGKATTGIEGGVGFGANFHFLMDKTGNVSWMLFTDADKLALYDDAAADGETFLTDPQACPRPCYRWYQQYAADPDYSSYSEQREQQILDSIHAAKDAIASQAWYYPNDVDTFNPNIWETGSLTKNSDGSVSLVTGQYGFGGFQFSGGRDLSKFKYLVVNFVEAPTSGGWSLRLFDNNSYWSPRPYETSCMNKKQVVVPLKSMYRSTDDNGGTAFDVLDPSHIYILGFWSYGGATLNIKDMFVTNNDDYSADAIDIISIPIVKGKGKVYNISGQRVTTHVPGSIIIRNGNKYISK